MDRNMFRRIEVMYPILDARLKQRLIADLDLYLADNTQAWALQAGGDYLPLSATGEGAASAQTALLTKLAESR
jgi:polyphosphate kinase